NSGTGGTITTGTLMFLSGSLAGDVTISGNVVNGGGTVYPGSGSSVGIFTITGNYTQYGEGTRQINNAGPTLRSQYGQLAVGGNVALAGTLNITRSFTPSVGNTFQILTFASRSGDFSTYVGLSASNGHVFQTQFNPTDLTLKTAAADIRVSPTT